MAAESKTTEDFAAKMGDVMRSSFCLASVCMGQEVGLFDVLAAQSEPKTSQELADAGDLKERYVRELLGALVMNGIVDLDQDGERYSLPAHRVPVLTRDGAFNDALLLGGFLISLGGEVTQMVKECFKKDGPRGLPYESYKNLAAMDKLTGKFLNNQLVPGVINHYPELKSKLDEGISVLDVGCGFGVSTIAVAKAFPSSTFCGFDFLEQSVKVAKEKAESLGLKNVTFEAHDAVKLPSDWSDKFDFVMIHDAIHDQARPDKSLKEIHRILVKGGIFLALEPMAYTKLKDNVAHPEGQQLLYMFSTLFCTPVSLYFEDGMGLGACWGREKAVEMLTDAGLDVIVAARNYTGRGQHFYCKKKH